MKNSSINFLDFNSFISHERNKGLIVSLTSGSIATCINYFLTVVLKYDIHTSTFISMYLIGNFFTYCFDILFAKSTFYDNNAKKEIKYNYNDYKKRLLWLLKSFKENYIIKYFVTITIDSIIGLSLLKWIISILNDYKIFTKNEKYIKYRNILVASLVGILTFFLYLNKLRFSWAYKKAVPNLNLNDIFNLIIIIWFSLCILIIVKFKDTQDLIQ